MAAKWQRNEPTESLRRCMMKVRHLGDGTKAPRETDFTGYVYISQDSTSQVLGVGTIANNRRRLVVADDTVEANDTGADTLTLTAHGYETGDGPFVSNEALGTVAPAIDFWIIVVDANTIQVADSLADAYAGTEVALNGTETAAVISDKATTERGVDGEFWYTATQAETDYAATEIWVTLAHATYEGEVSVEIETEAASVLAQLIENGLTLADAIRVILRTHSANFSDVGSVRTFRDLANTKNSHHATITASGRSGSTIDDAT